MCAAQDQNLTTKETEQITIDEQETSPLTSYAIYLRGLYSSMSHSHTSQHWSHLPESEFIQLAMIGSKGLRRGDREEEMVRLAQQEMEIHPIHQKQTANYIHHTILSEKQPFYAKVTKSKVAFTA